MWATLSLLDPSKLIICSANEARLLQIPEVGHFSCPVAAILLNNPILCLKIRDCNRLKILPKLAVVVNQSFVGAVSSVENIFTSSSCFSEAASGVGRNGRIWSGSSSILRRASCQKKQEVPTSVLVSWTVCLWVKHLNKDQVLSFSAG